MAALRSERGVTTVIDSSAAAPVTVTPTVVVVSSQGVLESVGDSRIVLHAGSGQEEVFTAAADANALFSAQREWCGVIRDAVRGGGIPADAPTFADGLAWNQVLRDSGVGLA